MSVIDNMRLSSKMVHAIDVQIISLHHSIRRSALTFDVMTREPIYQLQDHVNHAQPTNSKPGVEGPANSQIVEQGEKS